MNAKERAVVEAARRVVTLLAPFGDKSGWHDREAVALIALDTALRDLDAPCETCGGEGYVRPLEGYAEARREWDPCPTCGGAR